MRRLLTSPAFWAANLLQIVVTVQLCIAIQVLLDSETSFRAYMWSFVAVFAVVLTIGNLLYPRLEKAVLKDDDQLSDEQTAALERALWTGVLPMISLFADWGPALHKRRRSVESGRLLGPLLVAGLIALNIYCAQIDPDGVWFYWLSALFYAVLAVGGAVVGRRTLRHIRSLQQQLNEIHGGIPRDG